ncbi:MAG TPA: DUF4149 domain-containing protein [Humisphaera sp.]|nr:DUF4149 domain-containing protein [Humisphaera sp.]
MRRALYTGTLLAWGLWFGGLVTLFLAVTSIFRTFDQQRDIAGQAAAGVFRIFNCYCLGVCAAALVLNFLWWLAGRSGRKLVVFTLFALATVAAVYVAAVLTPKMESMRLEHRTHLPEFARLHGMAMVVYLGETILIFLAGVTLPWAARSGADGRSHPPSALQI